MEELMIHLRNNFGLPVGNLPPNNLVANGDFENGATNWNTGNNGFEAIYPDDASTGVQSAGYDTTVFADIGNPSTWADWRSDNFAVTPGEELRWEFRYKISSGSDGEILADRGFTDATLTTFVGEDVDILTSTGGQWVDVIGEFTVPVGVTAMDLRFNNIFTDFLDPFRGSFQLDDVAVYRLSEIAASDHDADGDVDVNDFSGSEEDSASPPVPVITRATRMAMATWTAATSWHGSKITSRRLHWPPRRSCPSQRRCL